MDNPFFRKIPCYTSCAVGGEVKFVVERNMKNRRKKMKAKSNKGKKFMWSVFDVYMEGKDGYRIQQYLQIYPVSLKAFSNLRKPVKKYLVNGTGKCLWCILDIYEDYYRVFMFAKKTSRGKFMECEERVAERIVQEKMHRTDVMMLL